MKLMTNKTALITGAAKRIGASCAQILAQNGAEYLFIADQDFEVANETAMKIAVQCGCRCMPIKVNAKKAREVQTLYEIIREKAGHLDVLVNCGNISEEDEEETQDIADWNYSMIECLKGAFTFSKGALHIMRQQNSGTIINVSLPVEGRIDGWKAGYASSKVELECLTKSLARRALSYGITVNGVTALRQIKTTL